MTGSHPADYANRYPQIVSFIGQTGADKSSLVSMLIHRQEAAWHASGTPVFQVLLLAISQKTTPQLRAMCTSMRTQTPTRGCRHYFTLIARVSKAEKSCLLEQCMETMTKQEMAVLADREMPEMA